MQDKIKLINQAIKQLEFLKNLPDQNKVIEAIQDLLKSCFSITLNSMPYITFIEIRSNLLYDSIISTGDCFYTEKRPVSNHKSIALMKALLKAKEFYHFAK